MQIKKFQAKTLKEAINQMKEEFGEEAIVLGTKVIDDFSNGMDQKLFEITASIDEEETTVKTPMPVENKSVKSFETEMKKLTERIYGVSSSKPEPQKNLNVTLEKKRNVNKVIDDSIFNEIKDTLADRDVNRKNINTIIDKLNQYGPLLSKANMKEYLTSTISSLIPTSDFILESSEKPKVISLVGPTGVGKTTAIAKLAVISKILHNLDIGLISIDTYRLGALDQLKIFSEISNIDFLVAYEPKDLVKFMKKFKNKDIVFIDTVGRSQNNSKLLNGINEFLQSTRIDETYLVLNSTSDYKVMLDIAKKFKVLNYDGVVFSKLDEAISYGNILNLITEIDVPIKYLTNGQVIPDDIIAADSEFIANMVYTGKFN